MDDASEPFEGDAAPPRARPVGGILTAAALVFAAAVVGSTAATVISVFSADTPTRLVDEMHLAAGRGVTLLTAGLLVGAALLLVAAEFHDVDSPWFPRTVGIVGGLTCIAVAAGVFVALDVPSWNEEVGGMNGYVPLSPTSTTDRIVFALAGLSVAAVAACAAMACWMLATGRIDFGRARVAARSEVDVPE